MKNSNLITKKIIIVIIAAIAIYSIFLFFSDTQMVYEKLQSFELKFIPVILIMIILGWLILFIRWNFLLKNQSIKIPIKDNFLIYIAGFSLSISPLKSGELLKAELLKNKFDVKRTTTIPIVLMERFYDIIGTVFVATIIGGLILGTTFLPIILLVSAITIIVFFIIYTKSVFNFLISKFSKIKFLKRFIEPLGNSQEVLRRSSTPKLILISTALTVGWRFVEGIGIYFILLGFGINLIEYLEIISIYSTSIIIGAVSMSPAGLGITEMSLGGLLSLLGIELSFALTLAIVIRIFTLWFGVIVGFVSLNFSYSSKN